MLWILLAFTSFLFAPINSNGAPADPKVFTILAYNIRHGEGMDGKIDLSRSASLINSIQPDIVTLQEVDKGVARTGGVDQAAVLAEKTGMSAVFGDFMEYEGGLYGMAILSRHPIKSWENHRLPEGAEPRSALAVTLELDGEEVIVVGIHLYRTEGERLAQARRLVEIFRNEKRPVILAGDFNSTPGSPVMQLFERHWVRPEKEGEGKADTYTFPSDEPQREIDFILYRPSDRLGVIDSRVLDDPLTSDHRPVLLTLRLR